MRLAKAVIQNFQGIELLEIEVQPDAKVITFSGAAGSGKTSAIRSIWWALSKKYSKVEMPIRLGEKRAEVELELWSSPTDSIDTGDGLRVRRSQTEKSHSLTVERIDGQPLGFTEQDLLDRLLGVQDIDPMLLVYADDRKRADILAGAISFDLDAWNEGYQAIFAERQAVNREAKQLEAQLGMKPEAGVGLLSEADIQKQLGMAQQANRAHHDLVRQLDSYRAEYASSAARIRQIEAELATLRARIIELDAGGKMVALKLREQPEIELSPLLAELNRINAHNAMTHTTIRLTQEWEQKARIKVEKESESRKLTEKLDKLQAEKRSAVEGSFLGELGIEFNEKKVLFEKKPFAELSTNEAYRICILCSIHSVGDIGLLRISQANLISEANMAWTVEQCHANDILPLIEEIDRSGVTSLTITQS